MANLETIFDHDVTEEEYDILFGGPIPDPDSGPEFDEDTKNGILFRLYSLRGNDKIAGEFYNKIKNHAYRLNLNVCDTD